MKSSQSIPSKSNQLNNNKPSNKYSYHLKSNSISKNQSQSLDSNNNSKGNVLQSKQIQVKQNHSNLLDQLAISYKDYQQHNSKWSHVFTEKILSPTNFRLDIARFSIQSLNAEASKLFQYESFWIMLFEIILKKTQGKREVGQFVNYFNTAFEYVTEVKMLTTFYYEKMGMLLGKAGVKKNDVGGMLNCNAQFMMKQKMFDIEDKKKKKSRRYEDNDKENEDKDKNKLKESVKRNSVEFITSKENFEIVRSVEKYKDNDNNNSDNVEMVNEEVEEDKESPRQLVNEILEEEKAIANLQELQTSIICNASTNLDYQNPFSFKKPQENINEQLPQEEEISKVFLNTNPANTLTAEDNIQGEDIKMMDCDDIIIPEYEQRKLLKVKEIMSEIESRQFPATIDLETLDQVNETLLESNHHPNQASRSITTPQRSRFSSTEKYPLDLVEGSIQKFNQSFSKSDHIHRYTHS